MKGYIVALTCGHCGGELRPVNQGQIIERCEVSGISKCQRCGREWHLHVTFEPVAEQTIVVDSNGVERRVAACGTLGGFARHLRKGERPCAPCLSANVNAAQDSKQRMRGVA